MTHYTISTNLDSLRKLPESDKYLQDYNWKQVFPGMTNRVQLEFSEFTEARNIYDKLWKFHITPLLKNW